MKALSIWQPWATLLAHGIKRIETRCWYMRHRGPLVIHASKKWDGKLAFLCRTPPFEEALKLCGIAVEPTDSAAKAAYGLPLGAIVGRVNVMNCVHSKDVSVHPEIPPRGPYQVSKDNFGPVVWIDPWEKEFGDFTVGRFGILCEHAMLLDTPLPWKGMQGLFDVGDIPDLEDRRGVCSKCGCTDANCLGCVQRTGRPCEWANREMTLCSACVPGVAS